MEDTTNKPAEVANAQLVELVQLIQGKYEQVVNPKEPDILFLKTWEISEKIREFYPGDFTDTELYMALGNAGFKVDLQYGLDFVWMLKHKESLY